MSKGDYNVVLEVDNDLQFQDFPDTTGIGGVGNSDQGYNNPNYFSNPSQPEAPTSNSIWSVDYYKQYFNVDTNQVSERMIQSLIPLKSNFLEVLGDNPDLYGPFWVATTVIFTMFITSSLAESIASYINEEPHAYDFVSLWFGTVTIYSYVFFASLAVWGATKYFGCQPVFLEILNIYGYGMTIWIPVSFLSVIPNNTLRWILTIIGFAISGYFMCKNIYHIILRSDAKITRLLVIAILITHFIVACIFKAKFFSYAINLSVLPDAGKNIIGIGN
ncbi:hypothetical protein K7432_002180 [Basidiobolus ranarum]|uniref:Protein YIP n=1 Tax=Basidiobolus ranarum TaxID=34480 RepID=A0ABR2W8C7_9FUNG